MRKCLIGDNFRRIRDKLPPEVEIVVAAKTRTPAEVAAALGVGARHIGENYVQEAAGAREALGADASRARWHMIGPLQRNKVNRALEAFDVVQTVDSLRLARALDARSSLPLSVYVEVNIAGEASKSGVPPGEARGLIEEMSALQNLRIEGLMTMEPFFEDPECARPYFVRMRELLEDCRALRLPNVDLATLSMGMSNSWGVAVQEGSNMVRIGSAIFGPR